MTRFFTLFLAASCLTAFGQDTNFSQTEGLDGFLNALATPQHPKFHPDGGGIEASALANNGTYGFEWEVVQEHVSGELDGMVTARLYFTMANPLDYLSAVSGDSDNPWIMESSSSPAWFNASMQGKALAHFESQNGPIGIDPSLFEVHPALPYDSWLTIGSQDVTESPSTASAWGPNSPLESLGTLPGVDFAIDDAAGGAIFVPFPGIQAAYEHLAFAGDDLRVLVGQFTTLGQISGQALVQVFVNGDQGQEVRDVFDIPLSPSGSTGCTDQEACNYSAAASADDGSCLYSDECGICGGSGIAEGDCDCNGNQLDAAGVCGGDCLADENGNGVCDNSEVYGCTYELAENYATEATLDDGSCIFPCEGVVNTNVFDWDGDYVVTVTDFLMMLSVYGDTDVDLDGVWDSGDDCVDTNACNYANDPSEPCAYIDVLGVCGGGCEGDEDNDNVCDDIDTCIGIEDECGVCNGPGPTEVVIDDITILYDSVYLPQLEEWYVYEFGADTTFSYTCAPFFGACGDPVGYQGYDYATVLIGEQCWFAENLRNENYENGDVIPTGLSDSEWSTTNSGAVALYGEDEGCQDNSPDIDACDPAQSLEEYGRLYNWFAVDDARGLCPGGWHVPTDGEWTVMTDELGGESIAGGQMKTTYGWYNGGNGTNSSGFSGLPGGYRKYDGYFFYAGIDGYWWSSSPSGSSAWSRDLNVGNEDVYRSGSNRRGGFSVRCVRDAE